MLKFWRFNASIDSTLVRGPLAVSHERQHHGESRYRTERSQGKREVRERGPVLLFYNNNFKRTNENPKRSIVTASKGSACNGLMTSH